MEIQLTNLVSLKIDDIVQSYYHSTMSQFLSNIELLDLYDLSLLIWESVSIVDRNEIIEEFDLYIYVHEIMSNLTGYNLDNNTGFLDSAISNFKEVLYNIFEDEIHLLLKQAYHDYEEEIIDRQSKNKLQELNA